MNPIIISSNINNRNINKTYRLLCHKTTTVVYFWLKSKIYSKKVPLMTDNTLTGSPSFISIYAFRDINSIILQHLYLIQLIYTNIHLRKPVDSICCHYWKQIKQWSLCRAILVFLQRWIIIWAKFDFHLFFMRIIWVITP